jgi:peroxiredoxin
MSTRLRPLVALLILSLLLAACAARGADTPFVHEGTSVVLAELPGGPGRGFPQVSVEAGTAPVVRTGEAAPDFGLVLDNGSTLTLESLRGRPVLINHWATWCGPCRVEMPEIVRAAAANPDLVVIGANDGENPENVMRFAEEYGMEFPVTIDPDGQLSRLFSVRALPMSIFIDREGVVHTIWVGLLTAEKLDEVLAEIL